MANVKQAVRNIIYLQPLSKKAPVTSTIFRRIYLIAALVITLGTTVYWSLLGAKLQSGNADQLVDPDLFKTAATLKGATFPGSHTMLIKWPIFWLVNVFGSGTRLIEAFTVGIVLLTVVLFLAIIYRIEHRPLVFGTICLALASVLLLVPPAPYAGALLPVNMAMLTTRNIEYVLFIFSLILYIRKPRIRSWGFWLSVLLLSLLGASDKLFLLMALGGAFIALLVYAKSRAWALANIATNLLIAGAIAAVGSYLILAIVSHSGLSHLAGASSSSPYNLTGSPKNIALGVIYGIMAIFTNFGANPAYDATEVKHIPAQFFDHLFSFAGPAYVVNLVILAIGVVVVYKVIGLSFRKPKTPRSKVGLNKSAVLSTMLLWVSLAAVISFVVTNHYYAVDARYLTIILFAVFICFASYSRTRKWQGELIVGAGVVLLVGIAFGVIGATKTYNADQSALNFQTQRNLTISQILTAHHSNLLVGDYWRVIPIKQDIGSRLTVTPLQNCTSPEGTLDSTAWQPNLTKNKFVYLLTIKGNLTNYPNCSIKQVVANYGRPYSSSLITGTLTNPQELLLFYDRGIHKHPPTTPQPAGGPSTVLPLAISELPFTSCPVPGVMNIVAHEDDDLLFMNPGIMKDIAAGDCVRTVYVTAGNAGAGEFYWVDREEGVEAAYSKMVGTSDIWVQRIVELAPNEFITVANPRDNARISLIFMHLPDGNLKGQGFSSSNFESLQKLEDRQINVINSVDNQSRYSSAQLIAALSTLMNVYEPSMINTQSSYIGSQFPDHSDHLAVSWFAKQAYAKFETQKYNNQVTIPISFYEGYPGRQSPANVTGSDLQEKEAVFLAYAKYDADVCQTAPLCLQTPTYNGYLNRQITSPY